MKTHYDLLGVRPDAALDEIRKAFRREIARYHPDKVQHLGREFQELAAQRSAELTEAYRVLMDQAARAAYDHQVAAGGPPQPQPPAGRPAKAEGATPVPPASPEPRPPENGDVGADWRAFQQERQSGEDFVRREALRRIRQSIAASIGSIGSIETLGLDGFELSYACQTRRSLFKKGSPDLYLLVHYVRRVDPAAIAELWPFAARFAVRPDATVCVFLLGPVVSPRPDLSAAISAQRKRTRSRGALVLVPIDVHDWEAQIPSNAPPSVKNVIQRLRQDS